MSKANVKETADQAMNNEQLDIFLKTASNLSENVVEASKREVDKFVEVLKDYPVHATIGAGVLGFLAGVATNKIFKQ